MHCHCNCSPVYVSCSQCPWAAADLACLPCCAVFQTNAEYGARSFLNGKARPGEHVTVSFQPGGRFPAVADANGEWEVEFNKGGVGLGPGSVTVSGEDGPSVVAKNVMGGDVYFCSGQQNTGLFLASARGDPGSVSSSSS